VVGGAVVETLAPSELVEVRERAGLLAARDGQPPSGRHVVRAALATSPTNSIPDIVYVRGEVRAFGQAALDAALERIRTVGERVAAEGGAGWDWSLEEATAVPPAPAPAASAALALHDAACEALGAPAHVVIDSMACGEANWLAARYDTLAMSSGGRDAHRKRDPVTGRGEEISVAELVGLEELLGAIVDRAAIRTTGA
jgi:metal-dependent amidase/aminoacylase/carboxypeptidase family protein